MYHHKPLPQSLKCLLRVGPYPAGWTLPEVLAVVAIVGILAGLAFPSFDRMRARMETRSALAALQQTLQQAQRNAIRMGKECRVQLDPVSNPPRIHRDPDPRYNGCLPYREVLLPNVNLHHNFRSVNIRFSYKGNSTNWGTAVVESNRANGIRYCLVISNLLGVMRDGEYRAEPPTVRAAHCRRTI